LRYKKFDGILRTSVPDTSPKSQFAISLNQVLICGRGLAAGSSCQAQAVSPPKWSVSMRVELINPQALSNPLFLAVAGGAVTPTNHFQSGGE